MKLSAYLQAFLLPLFCACFFVVQAQTGKPDSPNTVSISGKLLQADGKTLAYTDIELVPVDSDKQINDTRMLATSDARGVFKFAKVPDGKYTLSINFDELPSDTSPFPTFFYPNALERDEAEVFNIDTTTVRKNLVFQLPPKLTQRKVTGKVIGADGKPVADAFVMLKDSEFNDLGYTLDIRTDKNGNFTLDGFETRKYVILAAQLEVIPSIYTPPGEPIAVGNSDIFVLDAKTAQFSIKLKDLPKKKDTGEVY